MSFWLIVFYLIAVGGLAIPFFFRLIRGPLHKPLIEWADTNKKFWAAHTLAVIVLILLVQGVIFVLHQFKIYPGNYATLWMVLPLIVPFSFVYNRLWLRRRLEHIQERDDERVSAAAGEHEKADGNAKPEPKP